MDRNVGGLDRTGRLVIGAVLVLGALAGLAGFVELGLTLGLAALLIGAILLVTGTTRKCPINEAVGRDTYRR